MAERQPNPENQDHVTPPGEAREHEKEDGFLILTRKVDQGIVAIKDGKQLGFMRILGVDRDRVKVGLHFNSDIILLREELLEKERVVKESVNNPQSPQASSETSQ